MVEFLARGDLYTEDRTVITEAHWQRLAHANREMLLRLEILQKVRVRGNIHETKRAEMAYLQALQCVYDTATESVSDGARRPESERDRDEDLPL